MRTDKKPNKIERHFLYFTSYQALNLINYIVLVSMAAFFHFLLDHRLSDIEDWVFDKSWEILGIGRIVSVYFVFKFLSVRFEERAPFRKILSQFKRRPRIEVLSSIFFLFAALLILGQPEGGGRNPASFSKTITSYFGSSMMILSDCLIILILNLVYPLKEKMWRLTTIALALLSTLITVILFQSVFIDAFFLFFGMIMAYLLLKYDGEFSYVHSLVFCLTFFSPMVSLFGLDPLWRKAYSFLPMSQAIESLPLSILGLVVLIYLTLKRKLI